ncbi:hypothetical protein PHLH8_42010 [Pseudomonas sp. Pc102]|uniref:phage neck terminator protein n=1 Tax=Pseudomonas sp. Pc102 TaxID=2678261 RepID=UPI001BCB087E|nr:hypothetical protein [Pseudomonas sp. Pc102]BBP84559.1 hypothetical protein PHLH8_42010 [Pseudomonas sp. Pc102]
MTITATRLDVAALREALRGLLELPVGALIAADQAAAPPSGLYASLRETQSAEQGKSRREFNGNNERETVVTSCETTFGLVGFGTGALDLIHDARSVLQSSLAQDRLRRLGVALLRLAPIENLSSVEAGVAREQARLDLVLGHDHRVTLEQKHIASSVVTAHTDTGLTATLTVNPTET